MRRAAIFVRSVSTFDPRLAGSEQGGRHSPSGNVVVPRI